MSYYGNNVIPSLRRNDRRRMRKKMYDLINKSSATEEEKKQLIDQLHSLMQTLTMGM